ncbi:MAG: phospholipid carrier-dependent glycosyltransferase [Fimbriimonadaceae bacterium]|nr:phospholipid carrier-dependent glycosyltransferase [Fimbriimonadaceae bacterium]
MRAAAPAPGAEAPEPSFVAAVALRCAPLLVVFLIWLLSAATNLAWLRADNTPPAWDSAVHLTHSTYYYAYLTQWSFADALGGLGLTSKYYPPLTHLLGALAWMRYGVVQPTLPGLTADDIPVLANLLWMAVLLFSTYSLAARWHGQAAGLLAATLVACYPILTGQSRLFLLDYPLTALTALTFALLVASRGLTHPLLVWPLGLAAGAAFLCKWSFLLLIAPALVLALREGWQRLRAGDNPDLTRVRLVFNLVVVLAGLLLLAGPWYLSHPGATLQELRVSNQTWRIDDDPAVLSLGGLTYYLRVLLADQIHLPLTLLALCGGAIVWLRRAELAGARWLGCWIATGWVVMTLVPNKDPRFTMPLLPALAIASTAWLAPPPPGRRRPPHWRQRSGLVLAAVLLAALFLQQAVAFGVPGLPPRIGLAAAPLWSSQAHLSCLPEQRRWPHAELARRIAQVTPPGGRIGVLPNTAHVNYLTLRYYQAQLTLPLLLDPAHTVRVEPLVHPTPNGPLPTVREVLAGGWDTIVLLNGEQGAHAERIRPLAAALARRPSELLTAYDLAAELPMPGGEMISIWRRRAEPPG